MKMLSLVLQKWIQGVLLLLSFLIAEGAFGQTPRSVRDRLYKPQKVQANPSSMPNVNGGLNAKNSPPQSSSLPSAAGVTKVVETSNNVNTEPNTEANKVKAVDQSSQQIEASADAYSSEGLETYQRAAIAQTEEAVFLSCSVDTKAYDKKDRIESLKKNLVTAIQKARFYRASQTQPTLQFRWTSNDLKRRTEVQIETLDDLKKIRAVTLRQMNLKDKVKGPLTSPEVQTQYVAEKTTRCGIEGLKENP